MKYIILAQPKSASTSLLKTIGELIGESYGQQVRADEGPSRMESPRTHLVIEKVANKALSIAGLKLAPLKSAENGANRLRDDYPAVHYPLMSTVHVDICDFTDGHIPFSPLFALHKQHFPPTKGNILAFRKTPKIILIRDVNQTLEAYQRMTSLPGYFRYMLAHNAEFRLALKNELLTWQEGWTNEARETGGLILTFEDVTKRTPDSLALALNEFGIERTRAELRSLALAKERYTGGKSVKTGP